MLLARALRVLPLACVVLACSSFGADQKAAEPDAAITDGGTGTDGNAPPPTVEDAATPEKTGCDGRDATEFCDDFDQATSFAKWTDALGGPLLTPDGKSPPNALAIDVTSSSTSPHLVKRWPPGAALRVELEMKITTTDKEGEIDPIQIEAYQPTGLTKYQVALVRTNNKWIIEHQMSPPPVGEAPWKTADITGTLADGNYRHVVFEVWLATQPRVVVTINGTEAGRLDIAPLPAAVNLDVKVGAPWVNKIAAPWQVRMDNVRVKSP